MTTIEAAKRVKLPALQRPNGTTYRPRKIHGVGLGNEDEITHILVFGTHNRDFAEAHAAPDLERLSNEFYYTDFRLQISGPGKQGWYRRDLAGFEDDAPIYIYAEDPENGRAGVMFPVDEIEVTR